MEKMKTRTRNKIKSREMMIKKRQKLINKNNPLWIKKMITKWKMMKIKIIQKRSTQKNMFKMSKIIHKRNINRMKNRTLKIKVKMKRIRIQKYHGIQRLKEMIKQIKDNIIKIKKEITKMRIKIMEIMIILNNSMEIKNSNKTSLLKRLKIKKYFNNNCKKKLKKRNKITWK